MATPERSGFAKPRRRGGEMRTAMRKPDLPSKVYSWPTVLFYLHGGHNVSICALSLFSEAFCCNKSLMAGW